MNTNATTVCALPSAPTCQERAGVEPGRIQLLNRVPIQPLAAETRPAAVRISFKAGVERCS